MVQAELLAPVVFAGLTPDKTNNRQLLQAIQALAKAAAAAAVAGYATTEALDTGLALPTSSLIAVDSSTTIIVPAGVTRIYIEGKGAGGGCQASNNAETFSGAGGGAYDSNFTGDAFPGGNGGNGSIKYKWLP
ncbi:hypothetical protein BGC31_04845 [Komagataeibacter xylinus]|nr:hypothetical protein H845_1843 [Komagataeibacter xylinus E25]RFP02584.1 hypothetical protein BFX83_06365 [Komagataeibacter xylinus]RFP04589.1 hypothetical protein BGC31_04845 [Komagataeibacter xylinus]